jgi:flagellar motor switch protein FliN/FliY
MSAEQTLEKNQSVVRVDLSRALAADLSPSQLATPPKAETPQQGVSPLDLLRDVELHVRIELGRARMSLEDVLKLDEGSVVELDKLAGEPVDLLVNDRLVARGEVVVVNENFAVRVIEIVAAETKTGGG